MGGDCFFGFQDEHSGLKIGILLFLWVFMTFISVELESMNEVMKCIARLLTALLDAVKRLRLNC